MRHVYKTFVTFMACFIKLQPPFIGTELKMATRKLFRIVPFVFHRVKKQHEGE